jgi:hypothetical protein
VAIYVYGVVSASAPLPQTHGIGGEQIELITEDDLGALTSSVPDVDLSMGRDALDAHARVLQEAHAHSTVLPMRFGMIMADDDEVVGRLLVRFGGDLREQLVRFADKVELRLRATYLEEAVMREIVREDREIARLRESLRDVPREAGYYGQIRLGELVAAALERKRDRDAAGIIDALQPLALAIDVSPPPNDRIVMAASFLVSRDKVEAFDDLVNRIGEAQAGRMRFTYTGPFPPHSFVQIAQAA